MQRDTATGPCMQDTEVEASDEAAEGAARLEKASADLIDWAALPLPGKRADWLADEQDDGEHVYAENTTLAAGEKWWG